MVYLIVSLDVVSFYERWLLWLIPILRCWGRKPPTKKLTEVNGDAVEEEVTISSSIVDGDKALEVLVECFC